uniref:FOG: HEAT repeat n=1 Tax=Nonomuraea gerenzanensis TaxID=93944 RepID=A0A1M4DZ14_9ACTN|nr:FOG: HEAT repeat [Nonomuraea gerenzanensis]
MLTTLVNDPHWSVRWSLPDHPAAGVEVRRAICRSTDEVLRRLLAECPVLDEETNATLAADPSADVRGALAAHTDDPHLLATLMTDADPKVRAHATQNPLTTLDDHRLLANDRSALVRAAAVKSDRLPLDELLRLTRDRSINVRWWLATWPSTPRAVLRLLAEDPHPEVASQAQATLG